MVKIAITVIADVLQAWTDSQNDSSCFLSTPRCYCKRTAYLYWVLLAFSLSHGSLSPFVSRLLPPSVSRLPSRHQYPGCSVSGQLLVSGRKHVVCSSIRSRVPCSITFYAGRSAVVFAISRTRSLFGVQSRRLSHCQPCLGYRIYSGAPPSAEATQINWKHMLYGPQRSLPAKSHLLLSQVEGEVGRGRYTRTTLHVFRKRATTLPSDHDEFYGSTTFLTLLQRPHCRP